MAIGRASLIDVVSLCAVISEQKNMTLSEACDWVVKTANEWSISIVYDISKAGFLPVQKSNNEGREIMQAVFSSAWWVRPGKENDVIDSVSLSPAQVAMPVGHASRIFDLPIDAIKPRSIIGLPQNLPTAPSEFVSDQLAVLNRAAVEFWSTADKDIKSSCPKNNDVEQWLIQRGFSQKCASAGATIIRPPWAPEGRY